MAAKGSILKQEITEKILKVFPDSFLFNDGKEIRINGMENGEPLQIKVTLTASKTPVENSNLSFSEERKNAAVANINPPETVEKVPDEPSVEEKERLASLLNKLGF